jgi:hypothetical protein
MGAIESLSLLIGKWFGFVGACMLAPDATCRPFLAFVALAAAACAALVLVLMAYRAAAHRPDAAPAPEVTRTESVITQQRPPRPAPETRKPHLGGGLSTA